MPTLNSRFLVPWFGIAITDPNSAISPHDIFFIFIELRLFTISKRVPIWNRLSQNAILLSGVREFAQYGESSGFVLLISSFLRWRGERSEMVLNLPEELLREGCLQKWGDRELWVKLKKYVFSPLGCFAVLLRKEF